MKDSKLQETYTAESPDQRIDEKKIFDLVIDGDLELLEQKLGAPNIFELVGLSSSEIRHSNFLKNLLDPSSALGIGDRFIRFFLRHVLTSNQDYGFYSIGLLELELADFTNCTVYREYKNIDLLIEIKIGSKKFCICIENKIFAGESEHQLKKYRRTVEQDFREHKKLFIFLTPNGDSAENDNDWCSVSYDVVVSSVKHVLATAELSTDQELLLKHYKSLLEKHVTNNQDLVTLANQLYKRHRDAFDFIFEHKEDRISEINRRLQDWVISGDHGLNISLTSCSKTYVRFTTANMRLVSDFYPGNGWPNPSGKNGPNTQDSLLAEIQLTKSRISICFVIGPTVRIEDRAAIVKYLIPNPEEKRITKSYTALASEKLLSSKALENNDDLKLLFDDLTKRIIAWVQKETPPLHQKIDQLLAKPSP